MERIRSAIDKAREARGESAPARRARPELPAALTENWQTLAQADVNPRLLHRNRILAIEGGPDSGPFDMLRTKVLQQMRANNWRRLAITSPTSGCGKTTTSTNLAFSFARQPELRVVVVEADMRRPALAKTLGQKGISHQFSRVLAGQAPWAKHMLRIGPNLAFATNAAPVNHSAELLQSATARRALEEVEQALDPSVMIFDTPPLLVSDDTLGFLDQVDCVLLVAEAEATTIDEIDNCEQELAARSNVLGVVLNKCRYMGKGYGYDYDYGY